MRPSPAARRAALALLLLALLVIPLLPHGSMRPIGHMETDPATGRKTFVHEPHPLRAAGSILGQLSGLLLLASLALSFDRPRWPRLARARAHVVLGVLILALSLAHAAVLVVDGAFRGWIPGTLSLAAFAAHGLTGALKRRLARAWGPDGWRWSHSTSAWAALALTVEHVLMASWQFGLVRWLPHD